ncbi:hypothetical protein B0A49_06343 [Cryomyces minteri]|uniref:Sm domain-containing protein n=1 Tax=Cryomyces minteri TaxID=331657 RepID=A0A4U0X8D5_9PEZI|nr:hypothetical protein B0A49_06343 [Cryomyces minteri]
MLPLGLLTAAQGNPILVELKSGETINGHLVNCDTYMNLTLKEVVTTSADGKHFFRLSETYIRGNNIKFLRVPDETIDRAKDQQQNEIIQPTAKSGRRRLVEDQNLRDKDTLALYGVLRRTATLGVTKLVEELVELLIKDRREKPSESPELYHALIEANANHEHGSAGRVVTLLEEMQREGLEPSDRTCDAILKVLAVHPDYVLRAAVLEHLRVLWADLPADAHRNVVVGMLRDRQYEMALDRLDSMQSAGIRVEPWLWDMAIYVLCEADEIDEALALLKKRDALAELSYEPSVWAYVLDTASRAFHYNATLYVWRKRVEPGYLNPASGLCLNVLCTAARAGDPVLATDVFRVLGNRATVFEHQHYEMLIDTYLATDDVKTAISILSVMEGAKMAPDAATTRNLFKHLRADASRPHAALAVLQSLHEAGKPVPVAAVNVVLEALVHLMDLAGALDVYKTLHTLCARGPTVATFNALLRGCSSDASEADADEPLDADAADQDLTSDKKATAMFLAAEMRALAVAPDAVTYDRLILVCLRAPDCEDALRYYAEMRSRGWLPRPGTFAAVVKRLARDADFERAAEVLAQARDAGLELARTERWLEQVLWRRRRRDEAAAAAAEAGAGAEGEGRLAGFVRERLGARALGRGM